MWRVMLKAELLSTAGSLWILRVDCRFQTADIVLIITPSACLGPVDSHDLRVKSSNVTLFICPADEQMFMAAAENVHL